MRKVIVISSWHSFPAQNEHGEIERVKPDKEKGPCEIWDLLMIHTAKHLWEPVMEGPEDGKSCPPEDDIMKVSHNPVGIMEMDIRGKGSLKEACQPSD